MSENKNNPFRINNGSSQTHHERESDDNRYKARTGNRGGKFNGGGTFNRGGKFNRGEKFNRGGHGRNGNARGKIDYAQKEKEWGKVKFNPVADSAREEPATPWKKFKTDIVQTEAAAAESISSMKVETPAAKEFRKKREENYRKTLILEKQKEPTQWESFGNNEKVDVIKEKTKFKSKTQNKNKIQKITATEPYISKEVLKNFDSASLTFTQRNHLRKVITKTTLMAKGDTFKSAVQSMKKNQEKRSKR